MDKEIVNQLRENEPNGNGLMHAAADLIEHLRQRLHDCNEYALELESQLKKLR